MPSNPILVCARGSELRSELEAALAGAGHTTRSVTTPADAVAAMRDAPVDLIVAEGLAASGAIAALRTAVGGPPTPILVVAPPGDVEARIAFLEAGADDIIEAGFTRSELEGRVTALLIRAGRLRPESTGTGMAEIIAFFSPKGGVGTTTIAVNTAVLLAGGGAAGRSQPAPGIVPGSSRVLLVDLDLQFGQVATHLNLQPRYDISVLASDETAMADADIARSYLTMHGSGLAVLPAAARPESDFGITLEQVQRIFATLQPSFDHIVVDLGSRLDPRSMWVLDQADSQVVVLFPEIAALRAVSLFGAFLNEASTTRSARTHVVINHVFPKELLKSRDVENLLRAKPAAEVPYTEVDMIRSVNEGIPLVVSRPTAPATLAMRRIAQVVIGADDSPVVVNKPEKRGLFGRR